MSGDEATDPRFDDVDALARALGTGARLHETVDADEADEHVPAAADAGAAVAAPAANGADNDAPPMDELRARVARACAVLRASMALMKCGDIVGDGGGLTEAGLKLGFLVALGPTPGVRVESELPAGAINDKGNRRRMDVVLVDENAPCALVVELKYVRCGFMQLANYNKCDASELRYAKLTRAVRTLSGMPWVDMEKQGFLNPILLERTNGRPHVFLREVAKNARSQAAGYVASVTGNGQPILVGGERVLDVGHCTVIGVATRCFFNP